MGQLEVVFTIGLANPLMFITTSRDAIVIRFADTGNTVYIDSPNILPPGLVGTLSAGAFDLLQIRVERECTEDEGLDTAYPNNERMHINRDAGRAFFRFFETLRDVEARDKFIAGYPVAPSEEIQRNPLVRSCAAEWNYNGRNVERMTFTGIGAIMIRDKSWAETGEMLAAGHSVPAYRSFVHDAIYFATSGDPPRAIIMSCAAWETAMRAFLETVAATRSEPVYAVIARRARTIPFLYEIVRHLKGGDVSVDTFDVGLVTKKQVVEELPRLRNRLLHLGEKDLPRGKAVDYALAVRHAIDWLFQEEVTPPRRSAEPWRIF